MALFFSLLLWWGAVHTCMECVGFEGSNPWMDTQLENHEFLLLNIITPHLPHHPHSYAHPIHPHTHSPSDWIARRRKENLWKHHHQHTLSSQSVVNKCVHQKNYAKTKNPRTLFACDIQLKWRLLPIPVSSFFADFLFFNIFYRFFPRTISMLIIRSHCDFLQFIRFGFQMKGETKN